jgi:hypothetical protein
LCRIVGNVTRRIPRYTGPAPALNCDRQYTVTLCPRSTNRTAELFGARLEAAVPCRHAARAEQGDADDDSLILHTPLAKIARILPVVDNPHHRILDYYRSTVD